VTYPKLSLPDKPYNSVTYPKLSLQEKPSNSVTYPKLSLQEKPSGYGPDFIHSDESKKYRQHAVIDYFVGLNGSAKC
jgi:hypothetical protein